jgi:hypothetical protein
MYAALIFSRDDGLGSLRLDCFVVVVGELSFLAAVVFTLSRNRQAGGLRARVRWTGRSVPAIVRRVSRVLSERSCGRPSQELSSVSFQLGLSPGTRPSVS